MELHEYPEAIVRQSARVNDLEFRISATKQYIAQLEGNAELSVAIDPDLKNDMQRKCKRFSLLQSDPKYLNDVEDLNGALRDKADNLAQLEFLRNSFSVAKLEKRSAIVRMMHSFYEDIPETEAH